MNHYIVEQYLFTLLFASLLILFLIQSNHVELREIVLYLDDKLGDHQPLFSVVTVKYQVIKTL